MRHSPDRLYGYSLLFICFVFLPVEYVNAQERESIFDGREQIIDTIMDVPVYPRLEEIHDIKGRFELVNDINIWVEVIGEGMPVVLVSGGPGTSHHYFHPHFLRASEFCQLIYYDLRGVGLSDYIPASGYSITQAVEDLEGLRRKLGYDQWVVLGLSFGGTIAQMYAMTYPDKMMGMVLVSSTMPISLDLGIGTRQYDFMSERERQRIGQIYNIAGVRTIPVRSEMVDADLQMKMLYNAFSNGDWKRRHLHKWDERDIATYARYEFVQDRGYYRAMFEDYLRLDFTDNFKEFPIPTIVFESKWDLAYGENKAEIIFSQFPRASHKFYEKAGHIPWEDQPGVFFDDLNEFLRSLKTANPSEVNRWIELIRRK